MLWCRYGDVLCWCVLVRAGVRCRVVVCVRVRGLAVVLCCCVVVMLC